MQWFYVIIRANIKERHRDSAREAATCGEGIPDGLMRAFMRHLEAQQLHLASTASEHSQRQRGRARAREGERARERGHTSPEAGEHSSGNGSGIVLFYVIRAEEERGRVAYYIVIRWLCTFNSGAPLGGGLGIKLKGRLLLLLRLLCAAPGALQGLFCEGFRQFGFEALVARLATGALASRANLGGIGSRPRAGPRRGGASVGLREPVGTAEMPGAVRARKVQDFHAGVASRHAAPACTGSLGVQKRIVQRVWSTPRRLRGALFLPAGGGSGSGSPPRRGIRRRSFSRIQPGYPCTPEFMYVMVRLRDLFGAVGAHNSRPYRYSGRGRGPGRGRRRSWGRGRGHFRGGCRDRVRDCAGSVRC
jgi:hypothetical protein